MITKNINFYALGTLNTIQIYSTEDETAVRKAVSRILEIESRMSAFLPDSDLSRISRNAGKGSQQVHEDTFRLIQKAVAFGRLSDGTFDITIRPLAALWSINQKRDFIPSPREICSALKLVDYKSIGMNRRSRSCYLERAGQSIDLGGIAKGYAADEARRILIENHVKSALINLGGNVVTLGKRPDGQSWRIGIQNPLAPKGDFIGCLAVTDKTVITSGSNERFFIKDGVRYHHILDPRTGRPAQSSVLSVTAIGTSSVDADALTTALFILGPEKSIPFLKKFRLEAIFICEDLSVKITPGIKESFSLQKGVYRYEAK